MLGKISLILPVYNEVIILQTVLDKYIADLESWAKANKSKYEIIAVNDGSSDGSENILLKIAGKNRKLKVINLDGRYGKQSAVNAGFDATDKQSDAVILADIDILNPLGLLKTVIDRLESGEKIVYAKRENFGMNNVKATLSDISVKIGAKMFGVDGFYTGKANVSAYARDVADVLIALPERNKFLRTMDTWLGWKIDYISYISGLGKAEEKNIIASALAQAERAPKTKTHKPVRRDRIREHTATSDLMWGLTIASVLLFFTAIFFATAVDNVPYWVNLTVWLMFGVVTVLALVLYFQSVLIKRVGIIYGKTSVKYKIRDKIN